MTEPSDILALASPWAVAECDNFDVLCGMPDESVDLVLTDPPYGINHDSNMPGSEWAGPIAGDDAIRTDWLAAAARVLKGGGAAYVFTRWDVEAQWAKAIEAHGLLVKQSLIWAKGTHGTGDLHGTWGPSHERILFATKGRHILRPPRLADVLTVAKIFSRSRHWHPHEKPVALLDLLVRASSDPGDLVMDPFCGGGSTLVAACLAGRRAIGCEIDPRYAERSRQRLQGAARGDPEGLDRVEQTSLFGSGGELR